MKKLGHLALVDDERLDEWRLHLADEAVRIAVLCLHDAGHKDVGPSEIEWVLRRIGCDVFCLANKRARIVRVREGCR